MALINASHWKIPAQWEQSTVFEIREVRIGDPIYHHWTCKYGPVASQVYCMIVNNCTVSTSQPNSLAVPIIDEHGCSLFPNLIPHVSYMNDLDAGLKSNAFSLDIEQPTITFHCNIKLLLKMQGVCRRPQCIPIDWYQRRLILYMYMHPQIYS
ncbi:unnamed protein product [Dracunculus medinensis]|uniref:ZP domain-containing protein n=1 Tax=Dracunculus medinensis TaxID=318479 RepID=A0A0N4UL08_DRAME|nr:unnamed protein product [Dracunculus medinensis]